MFLTWAVWCGLFAVSWGQNYYVGQPSRQYSPYVSREQTGGVRGGAVFGDTGVAQRYVASRNYNSGAYNPAAGQSYVQPSSFAGTGRDLNVQGSTRTGSPVQQVVPRPIVSEAPRLLTTTSPPARYYVDDDDRLLWENPPPEIPFHAFALEDTHPSKLQARDQAPAAPAGPAPIAAPPAAPAPVPVQASLPAIPVAAPALVPASTFPSQPGLRIDTQSVPLNVPELAPARPLQPTPIRPFEPPTPVRPAESPVIIPDPPAPVRLPEPPSGQPFAPRLPLAPQPSPSPAPLIPETIVPGPDGSVQDYLRLRPPITSPTRVSPLAETTPLRTVASRPTQESLRPEEPLPTFAATPEAPQTQPDYLQPSGLIPGTNARIPAIPIQEPPVQAYPTQQAPLPTASQALEPLSNYEEQQGPHSASPQLPPTYPSPPFATQRAPAPTQFETHEPALNSLVPPTQLAPVQSVPASPPAPETTHSIPASPQSVYTSFAPPSPAPVPTITSQFSSSTIHSGPPRNTLRYPSPPAPVPTYPTLPEPVPTLLGPSPSVSPNDDDSIEDQSQPLLTAPPSRENIRGGSSYVPPIPRPPISTNRHTFESRIPPSSSAALPIAPVPTDSVEESPAHPYLPPLDPSVARPAPQHLSTVDSGPPSSFAFEETPFRSPNTPQAPFPSSIPSTTFNVPESSPESAPSPVPDNIGGTLIQGSYGTRTSIVHELAGNSLGVETSRSLEPPRHNSTQHSLETAERNSVSGASVPGSLASRRYIPRTLIRQQIIAAARETPGSIMPDNLRIPEANLQEQVTPQVTPTVSSPVAPTFPVNYRTPISPSELRSSGAELARQLPRPAVQQAPRLPEPGSTSFLPSAPAFQETPRTSVAQETPYSPQANPEAYAPPNDLQNVPQGTPYSPQANPGAYAPQNALQNVPQGTSVPSIQQNTQTAYIPQEAPIASVSQNSQEAFIPQRPHIAFRSQEAPVSNVPQPVPRTLLAGTPTQGLPAQQGVPRSSVALHGPRTTLTQQVPRTSAPVSPAQLQPATGTVRQQSSSTPSPPLGAVYVNNLPTGQHPSLYRQPSQPYYQQPYRYPYAYPG